MEIIVDMLTTPWEGVLAEPVGGSAVGVLVLAGSSGRIETHRCDLLARAGMAALSLRWFGGAGQPGGICEVPLETFTKAIDLLQAKGVDRIGVLGASKGAEAALLLAAGDPRIDAVVALSPTSLVWGNLGPGLDGKSHPYRSCWTWRGEPRPVRSVRRRLGADGTGRRARRLRAALRTQSAHLPRGRTAGLDTDRAVRGGTSARGRR
ncbi:acyl-CoA thioester hydrolase/BAAT C-terminal domain-containing protein [Streptomyces sp. NPDC056682]|uniref:acyl-CoA thioester hydrolase/BAAT C-terminal domain-containing protein n=1 Tax=Streptomyces sp. NPDC056682 TaxID=3345909 RepID=UPI00367C2813